MKKGVMQHDIRDCGAACLATLFLYYKLKVPLVHIREQMQIDKNGANLYAIAQTAEKFFFKAEVLCGTWEELLTDVIKQNLTLPAIVQITSNDALAHYIVVYKITNKKIIAFDPANGSKTYSVNQFTSIWTGYVVSFTKTANFQNGNLKKGTYNKFLALIYRQKKQFFFVMCISLVLGGISIISAWAYQYLIDSFLIQGPQSNQELLSAIPPLEKLSLEISQLVSNINHIFVLIVGVYLIQMLILLVRGIVLSTISKKINGTLMDNFFKHLMKLPIRYFKDRETGEILSRFNDIEEIQDIISGAALILILDSIMAVAGGIILASIEKSLFLLVVLLIGIYFVIVITYRKPISETNKVIMEDHAQFTSNLKESIEGIETIKTLNGEKRFYVRLNKCMTKYLDSIFKGSLISITQNSLLITIEGIGTTGILCFGSWMVLSYELSLGTLLAFLTLVNFFTAPLQRLIALQLDIQQAFIAAERLNDVFEVKKETNQKISNLKALNSNSITLKNISFAYGYRPDVLKHIFLEIKSGEKVAVVGPNGCGKSSLLQLITAFYRPNRGVLEIGGIDINRIPIEVLREKISYVSQNSILFSGDIKENILFGRDNIDAEILNFIIEGCHLDSILNNFPYGLDTVLSENGKELSGGQRQRIAIARALITMPQILIFDESTSNIDPRTEKAIFDFIYDNYKKSTCIFATHNLKIIENCENVIFLNRGKIEGLGTHENLYKYNKKYKRFILGIH
ncbi:peptidase domain-containing ABC transporter [Anaerovorax odorimutans]|uniref:Peptidase domain-containing ABC transporter n=1 Tax=Anaerovorax odorimutans TaxID=109327 RepID=A0ABT1RTH2_9FIRM|nr:peptidase domain-containing ABC transporter [Anaerovorax odorimutans]MCQ4638511.1 peptidase domain-containing ABC transporter [Anaerovorax odorimutans]